MNDFSKQQQPGLIPVLEGKTFDFQGNISATDSYWTDLGDRIELHLYTDLPGSLRNTLFADMSSTLKIFKENNNNGKI